MHESESVSVSEDKKQSTCESLYRDMIVVTNRQLCQRPFLEQMERVLRCHPSSIVLREKDLSAGEYEELAKKVIEICEKYQVECILHYYPEVATKLNVKYIHLPLWKLEELSSKEVFQKGNSSFEKIGCSVHSVEEAVRAQQLGATYLSAGHIYTTDCKKGLPPRGIGYLRDVCEAVTIPVYGIGGIGLDEAQIKEVKSCGAKGVCIMSAMMTL